MNIIIPIGGKGERFLNRGYKEKKPLINILGKPMISYVLDNLKFTANDKVFIIYYDIEDAIFKNLLSEKHPLINFVKIDFQTRGAAETIFEGLKKIRTLTDNKKTMLFDCDTFYTEDVISLYRNIEDNAVFYTINDDENPIYSYIKTDHNNFISNIAEKVKISNKANTGIYCFKNIDELNNYSGHVIKNNITFNNEFYTSCIIDAMIQDNNLFLGVPLNSDFVFNLGTPEQVENYIKRTYSFLFDLDGTIVLSEHVYFNVWKELLQEYNYNLTEDVFKTYISGNNDETVLKNLLKGSVYSLDKLSRKKDELFIKKIGDITLIRGVEPMLKIIQENGHKLAIVTNCNRNVSEMILSSLNLTKYFEFIIVGNECNNPKPFPDPYKKAIDMFNCNSDKTIIFEDSKTGLLSAYSISPRCIVGIETSYSSHELLQSFANITMRDFVDCKLNSLLDYNYHQDNMIKKCISNSIKTINIDSIEINATKLKGGFISDVIDIKLCLENKILKCVGKMENKNDNFLTQMSNDLELYSREYYFYQYISHLVPVKTPKFYGLICDDNNKNIGLLLENINDSEHRLNLNLNNENIDVSLRVIESLAKMHSMFWGKTIREFLSLRKNNDSLFNPFWSNFIKSKWPTFKDKWRGLLTNDQFKIAEHIFKNFSSIQQRLSDKNLTFCHGDVKSANIFYKINGDTYDPVFIDWQYIILGKGVQDLVFFMIESFDTHKMKLYKALFKEYYYVKLIQNGIVNYSRDEYDEDFTNASYYFPFFVAIWFGTLNEDELIDKHFPCEFITRLFNFYTI
jgi:beta-phosphoglucomutase-like phosphatase (HAD superfamily)/choline kinase